MEDKKERHNLVAPCGIDCGICELYLCSDNRPLMDFLISKGIPENKLPCSGCREMEGHCPVIGKQCSTFVCTKKKDVSFCFECNEFPCDRLHPSADRADVLPHNLKVFNLCSIKKDGMEGFVKKSADIKKTYFKGKMVIGSGPKTEE